MPQRQRSRLIRGNLEGGPSGCHLPVTDLRHNRTAEHGPEKCETWRCRLELWCHMVELAGSRETERLFVSFDYRAYLAVWEEQGIL